MRGENRYTTGAVGHKMSMLPMVASASSSNFLVVRGLEMTVSVHKLLEGGKCTALPNCEVLVLLGRPTAVGALP